MNGVAVLTVPRFTGQADTSSTGEEVSDIEQTHLTERGHAGVSVLINTIIILVLFRTMEKELQLCQVWNCTNAFSHSGINYIYILFTFIILFECDLIAFMLKNTMLYFSHKKEHSSVEWTSAQSAVTTVRKFCCFY